MIQKLLSGRWILTVTTAIVFALLSLAGRLDAKDVMAIVVLVFTLYFTRNDRVKKEDV